MQIQVFSSLNRQTDRTALNLVLSLKLGVQLIGFLGSTNCLHQNVKKTFFEFLKSKGQFCQALVASSLTGKIHKLTLKLL